MHRDEMHRMCVGTMDAHKPCGPHVLHVVEPVMHIRMGENEGGSRCVKNKEAPYLAVIFIGCLIDVFGLHVYGFCLIVSTTREPYANCVTADPSDIPMGLSTVPQRDPQRYPNGTL